jgi:hypothetical protein
VRGRGRIHCDAETRGAGQLPVCYSACRKSCQPVCSPLCAMHHSAGAPPPQQHLKVRLRPEGDATAQATTQAAGPASLDIFTLSRTLGSSEGDDGGGAGEAGASGTEAHVGRRALGADEARTLSKLVGCLTKEGKRSRAQRVVTDALHIINAQLRKGGGKGGGGTQPAGSKG